MAPIDIQELIARRPKNRIEELRLEIYEKVNQLGIWGCIRAIVSVGNSTDGKFLTEKSKKTLKIMKNMNKS